MLIDIIGCESLGVRGLCCSVEIQGRRFLIDPGVALGYRRAGRLPHPLQVAVGERVRNKIVSLWSKATDIVISHYHGDHVPLPDANPFQLALEAVFKRNSDAVVWTKSQSLSTKEQKRFSALKEACPLEIRAADPSLRGILEFSSPISHGAAGWAKDTVIATKIQSDKVFVHASDSQLLNDTAVNLIVDWRPDIILAGGPPLYLTQVSDENRLRAWENALILAKTKATLIIDHHLLRSREGERWLARLSEAAGRPVLCGADFMGGPRLLMEADRKRLYREMPVPDGWHADYSHGRVRTDGFWKRGLELGWVSQAREMNTDILY